jgi:hypothetical protein
MPRRGAVEYGRRARARRAFVREESVPIEGVGLRVGETWRRGGPLRPLSGGFIRHTRWAASRDR